MSLEIQGQHGSNSGHSNDLPDMTAMAPTYRSIPGPLSSSRPFLVGVEVGPALIRAGVFSESFDLIGKAKVSTKTDRGTLAVLERIARCVEYAADECDVPIEDVRALAVGVPGRVDADRGVVLSAASLGWKDVPLRSALEKFLRVPVFVENHFRLSTLGVFAREIPVATKRFAALFLGPEIGGGFIVEGKLAHADTVSGERGQPWPDADGVFAALPDEQFRHVPVKDLRKAIRKGNAPVREFARTIAAKAGDVSAQLVKLFEPEIIVLGGGLIDEIRQEVLTIVEGIVFGERAERGTSAPKVRFLASALGDLAGITGGATLAARFVAAN